MDAMLKITTHHEKGVGYDFSVEASFWGSILLFNACVGTVYMLGVIGDFASMLVNQAISLF